MIKIIPDEKLLGRKIPMRYGLAWRKFDTAQSVMILWPFNLLVAFLRLLWLRLRFAVIKGAERKYYDAGWADGWRTGVENGRAELYQATKKMMEKLE